LALKSVEGERTVRIARQTIVTLTALVAIAAWSAPALASTVRIQGGDTLLVEGAQGGAGKGNAGKEANTFLITFDGKANRYEITDVADISTTNSACTDAGQTISCAATGITTISVKAGSGDDKAKVSATPASSVTLEGEDGNDTLSGGDDAVGETLNGGKGNDLMLGGNGPDQFLGAQGFDSVSYSDHTTAGVVATIGTTADDGNAADGPPTARDNIDKTVEKVAGTSFADLLTGSRNDDVLVGLAGNDRLKGLAGADIFKGKGGIDILLARDGQADTKLNCGPGANSRERAKRDRGLDPAPKSC
jgi:Ca2+-binding RTX toxin-like protein